MISYLFGLLFFLVPLVFFPSTSELFEFNKLIVVYIFTILITGVWIIETIRQKKLIFKRTLLDIPLLIYLGVSLLCTLFSIDVHTSIFGYYGRFNGGFLSLISYALLYWAFVSNVGKKSLKYILYSILLGTTFVSLYGILEHFGHSFSCLIFTKVFDDSCWVQDVQARVFATMGQPNWMAAYLVSVIPLTWFFALKEKQKTQNKLIWIVISITLLLAVWFTKSRSGLLGLGASIFVFLVLLIWKRSRKIAVGFCVAGLLVGGIVGLKLLNTNTDNTEGAGTESGEIRQLVWQGAIGVWQHHPILGGGLETFAYTFPQFRPVAHNLTSEWDFIYNKAHNEYLNNLANTGIVGITSYFIFIVFSIILIIKGRSKTLNIALLSGYVSILVTNFFGFSVTVTQLFLFLIPAISVISQIDSAKKKIYSNPLTSGQKSATVFAIFLIIFGIFAVSKYWRADYLYQQSKNFAEEKKYSESINSILAAFDISAHEPIYHDELAGQLSRIAVGLKDKNATDSADFAEKADEESKLAIDLSFYNVPLRKSRIRTLLIISDVDKNYLLEALPFIEETQTRDGNDPFIFVEKGKTYVKLGQIDMAIENYKKAVELKSNYQDARFALGVLYKIKKDYKNAKEQFEYILKYLSPDDELVKEEIKGL